MFDVLIREAGARFGIGDKALPLAQMLLASMTQKETGGLPGFLEKFKAAGLGPLVQSWLGGGPSAQPLSNEQVESALGGGLLGQITSRLGVGRDSAASALGYLVPAIVGMLTPGGSMPASLPPAVTAMAAAGQNLLAAPAAAAAAAGGAGFMKWLPWAAVALAALLGLGYCSKQRGDIPEHQKLEPMRPASNQPGATPAEGSTAEPTPAASGAPVAVFGGGSGGQSAAGAASSASMPAADAASTPPAADAGTGAAAANADASAAADEAPAGAGVVALMVQDKPALKVYFDSGKTAVDDAFAAKAADLLAYLQANAGSKAVISGFNDPTGNAAANAELSKKRAQAVQAALTALGVAEDRTVLEKPADATDTSAGSNAASRRVEVILRD